MSHTISPLTGKPYGLAAAVSAELRDDRGTAPGFACSVFQETHNTTWLVERHGFLASADFRHKQLQTKPIAA